MPQKPSARTIRLTKEFLYEQYVVLDKSAIQIARDVGYTTGAAAIYEHLARHNIPRKNKEHAPHLTKELLSELYVNQKKTACEIARKLKLTHLSTVYKALVRHGIKRRRSADRVWATGPNNPKWRGHELISGSYWYSFLSTAKLRNIQVHITIQEGWNLYLEQNGKCALSGVEIGFPSNSKLYLQTASIDRIDSNGDYTLDNIQWIHKELQWMKWDKKDESFIEWCCVIADYQRGKSNDYSVHQV